MTTEPLPKALHSISHMCEGKSNNDGLNDGLPSKLGPLTRKLRNIQWFFSQPAHTHTHTQTYSECCRCFMVTFVKKVLPLRRSDLIASRDWVSNHLTDSMGLSPLLFVPVDRWSFRSETTQCHQLFRLIFSLAPSTIILSPGHICIPVLIVGIWKNWTVITSAQRYFFFFFENRTNWLGCFAESFVLHDEYFSRLKSLSLLI